MRIWAKIEIDEDTVSRPSRLPMVARDILAATLLTLAAAAFIGLASTSSTQPPENRPNEAVAKTR